jgi:hypothetical protein
MFAKTRRVRPNKMEFFLPIFEIIMLLNLVAATHAIS